MSTAAQATHFVGTMLIVCLSSTAGTRLVVMLSDQRERRVSVLPWLRAQVLRRSALQNGNLSLQY